MGNICRSPLAEGIFLDLISKNGCQDDYIVDSAGTSNFHIGELSDHRTRKNAKSHGLDLVHKARQFNANDFHEFDIILAMDDSNLKNMNAIRPNIPVNATVYKMRNFDKNSSNTDVPDPWFGGEKGFEEVYQLLNTCCQNLFTFLREKKSK